MSEQELKRLALEVASNTISETGNRLTAQELIDAATIIYEYLK